jgi:hypothetical protein
LAVSSKIRDLRANAPHTRHDLKAYKIWASSSIAARHEALRLLRLEAAQPVLQALLKVVGPAGNPAPRNVRGHIHINEVSINEISFQPPQTTKVVIVRTKRLPVPSSRPGCAVGGKSKPSSDSRTAEQIAAAQEPVAIRMHRLLRAERERVLLANYFVGAFMPVQCHLGQRPSIQQRAC